MCIFSCTRDVRTEIESDVGLSVVVFAIEPVWEFDAVCGRVGAVQCRVIVVAAPLWLWLVRLATFAALTC